MALKSVKQLTLNAIKVPITLDIDMDSEMLTCNPSFR